MCIYLLRMQEFYRWKEAVPLDEPLNPDILGSWVRDTEDYWDSIEHNNFRPVTIDGKDYDPFYTSEINQGLDQYNLVYSAGIGRLGQPHFVLGECTERTAIPYPKIDFGKELARDIITLPAMTCNGTIFIRHESIVRMLWQMVSEWRLKMPVGPMANVVNHFQLDGNAKTPQIETAAKELSPLLIHHEYGEIEATKLLGAGYSQMIIDLQGNRGEIYARAVADLLADSLGTWPYLVKTGSTVHLDFWLASLFGVREELFTSTDFHTHLTSAGIPLKAMADLIEPEQNKWQHVATELLDAFTREGKMCDYKKVIENALRSET